MGLNEACQDCSCNDMCNYIECKNQDVLNWKGFKREVLKMIIQPKKELCQKEWVFRGLLKHQCLKTTLERFRDDAKIPWKDLPQVEAQLIREVERKSFGFGIPLPPITDKMWWASLMRHYGAPTRLLDWTYSPYVAAYFAFEKIFEQNTEEDVVVWAVQYQWTRKPRKTFKFPVKCTWDQIEKSEPHALDFLFDPEVHKQPFVMQVNTYYLHERLTTQQGVFLCPTDVSRPFMENFRDMRNWEKKSMVRKLTISRSAMAEAMAELQKMNITRQSLFPGFAGFVESLKTRGAYFFDLAKNRSAACEGSSKNLE
jgi:hypothetical protein